MDAREDGLLMSGIQHFAFCRRQWALIHIEQQWQENARTAQGQLDHVRCHDETLSEKRDDTFIVRGMRVFSRKLNLSGACDVVEFHKDKNGISLEGQPDFGCPTPSSTSTAAKKRPMPTACSSAPKPWHLKKCSCAIFLAARSTT